eukprot:TRINITY_DN10160_c0_g1_i1.p1 TRINITY_DN10160_c0_g1~~TRINITY_DN10160_c0_g1_i1.p1  ORF type:complete len:136 (+),score=18.34 TRINITY_DN10160_c0_g1_i1:1149-1556(+)
MFNINMKFKLRRHEIIICQVVTLVSSCPFCAYINTYVHCRRIIKNEGFFSLYKGLTAVMAGIVPKMAVRFSSFDLFKTWLGCLDGKDKSECYFDYCSNCLLRLPSACSCDGNTDKRSALAFLRLHALHGGHIDST